MSQETTFHSRENEEVEPNPAQEEITVALDIVIGHMN